MIRYTSSPRTNIPYNEKSNQSFFVAACFLAIISPISIYTPDSKELGMQNNLAITQIRNV